MYYLPMHQQQMQNHIARTYGHHGGLWRPEKIKRTNNHAQKLKVQPHQLLADNKMIYSSYMVIKGGSICGFSTLQMHRCNTNHTKSSARKMIDGEFLEKAPGKICTQYGLMDHIHLWRSTLVREPEEGCLCFFVFRTTFWYLIMWKNYAQLNE